MQKINDACDGRTHVLGPVGWIEAYFDTVNTLPEAMDNDDLVLSEVVGSMVVEIDRLRKELDDWTEREAAICPEDVGFEELIEQLRKELAEVRERLRNSHDDYAEACKEVEESDKERERLRQAVEGVREKLQNAKKRCIELVIERDQVRRRLSWAREEIERRDLALQDCHEGNHDQAKLRKELAEACSENIKRRKASVAAVKCMRRLLRSVALWSDRAAELSIENCELHNQLANLEKGWPHGPRCASRFCSWCKRVEGAAHDDGCPEWTDNRNEYVEEAHCGECDCNRLAEVQRRRDG
jgi:DNA repair exonuclease SbcCD ATPase subunit